MIYIHGIGHFHPENVLSNEFLESLDIGTNDQWIVDRVGIRERRTVLSLDYIRQTRNQDPRAAAEASSHTNAQTGAKAAKLALDRAGLKAQDIGMVIAGGCSPQHTIPAEACVVAAELGLSVPAFDINSACSSFAAQLTFLGQMRSEALPDYVLIVNAENTTRTVNYSDRSTAVLWGDGTTATIVSTRHKARLKASFRFFESDPSGWKKVLIPAGGFFTQDGPAVQTFAIRKTCAAVEKIRSHIKGHPPAMKFISHQANLTMLESVIRRMEIEPSSHLYNVDRFGNCGAAGAPSVLSQNWQSFEDGDHVALVVVGSGLAWGGMLLEFGEPQ
jgi:3-oxoacyl-[acyl-carrier-protein] synthase-3